MSFNDFTMTRRHTKRNFINKMLFISYLLLLFRYDHVHCFTRSPLPSTSLSSTATTASTTLLLSPTPSSSSSSSPSYSILKYSNLPQDSTNNNRITTTTITSNKVIDEWFGKWFEINIHQSFQKFKEHKHKNNHYVHMPSYFTPDFTSVDGLGGVDRHSTEMTDKKRHSVFIKKIHFKKTIKEIDQEILPGSTITHFLDHDKALEDIEMLPSSDSMIDMIDLHHKRKVEEEEESVKDAGKSNIRCQHYYKQSSIIKRIRCRSNHQKRKDKDINIPFSFYGSSHYLERMNLDIRHLSLSIAGNIDNQEQWKEFFEDTQGEGLRSILQCVKDCAAEIKLGMATDTFDDNNDVSSMLDRERRRENAFVASCAAVKVLRDLCSIDHNWASVMTDEILTIDQTWRDETGGRNKGEDGVGFLEDLAIVLKYGNEADLFHSRKVFRKRKELRAHGITIKRFGSRKQRRLARKRCTLYINQLLLGMAIASDHAINTFRSTPGLLDSIIMSSSYNAQQKLKGRWYRYPIEHIKRFRNKILRRKTSENVKRPFLEAAKVEGGLIGNIQATSNKLLAALGHNIFVPKVPGQKGLRILSLDGGGTRGIASIAIIKAIVDEMGVEVCDLFDVICGTSTGAIIAFLVGLKLESSQQAKNRYDELIEKIFVKRSTPMLFLTTAAYSEVPFNRVTEEILGNASMLDSRADPRVPYVFAVSSKMSSTTSKLSLFRNYNYRRGEQPDTFVVHPEEARRKLRFKPKDHFIFNPSKTSNVNDLKVEGSRHEGSFRVLQRAALRATTAAPTYFKPVVMGNEIYSDGGIVASNPAAVAIHEARSLFPNIPIELFVSCGTGEFVSEKVSPSFGWDGIATQIIKSATDTARTHWVLEDILGKGNTCQGSLGSSNTKYFRFDPIIGTSADFPIDGTDAKRLELLSNMTTNYMKEDEQTLKLQQIKSILAGENNLIHRLKSNWRRKE